MGKYIRKAKAACELAVMEATQSSLGVRTRAKTLASQRLQKSHPAPLAAVPQPQPPPSAPATASSGSYLQLWSRRLPKPPIVVRSHCAKRQLKVGCGASSAKSPSPGARPNPRARSSLSAYFFLLLAVSVKLQSTQARHSRLVVQKQNPFQIKLSNSNELPAKEPTKTIAQQSQSLRGQYSNEATNTDVSSTQPPPPHLSAMVGTTMPPPSPGRSFDASRPKLPSHSPGIGN